MQAQERELIAGLFGRLQPFEAQPRDAEAEALIKDFMARQPAAAYLLAQAVLVQEHALKAAQERIAELEASAKAAPPAAAPSFLGSAPSLGPWGAQPAAPRASVPTTAPAPMPPAAPPSRSPLQAALAPQAGAAGGGGFLRTAMMTAAGVAGGALLFEGIRGLMGNSSSPFGQSQAAQPSPLLPPDSAPQQQQAWSDTPADSQRQADNQSQPDDQFQQDQPYQDDYDTASLDDGGSDDSWA